ncbi:uncharacterized protein LOC130998758 [Salvia miltiorrhiza]|uniref:uncharacterized protein LOC130998758 n=1 Tax=Salvia miltiorrhiza TaxID=226208 RepID=UPI0025ACCA13|nr:uncharacterized protein LOC130998758 [Salvia miltiorrhiza]
MVLKESDGNSLEYDFFADIMDQSKDLVIGAIDLYMLALRIRNGPGANAIRGVGIPNTQRSWINATQVIVPCLVGSHYVVCRLDLHEGICELYDSLHYCLNEDTRAYRVQQLSGILKLLPRLLLFGEWFAYSPIRSPNFQNRMEFILRVAAPTLQFNQTDNVSCGVFCCMQVERLTADSPSIEWGHGHVTEYRWNIAARIFDLCKTPAVELEDSRVCPHLSN